MNAITKAGIGHNNPPLAETLAEETAALKQRAADLAAAAGRAKATDDDTAGKAVLLIKMMSEHRKDIEAARETAVRPHLEGQRTVNAHFAGLDSMLAETDAKKKVVGGPLVSVTGMVDAYRLKKEAEAAAERRWLEEEARKQRVAAEAADRARREAEDRSAREAAEAQRKIAEAEAFARQAGDREAAERLARERAEAEAARSKAREDSVRAELESRQASEQAEALVRQAAATTSGPIDSGFGVKASGRKSCRAEITDLTAALKHAVKVDKAAILAAVQQVYDRQVRAGVRELPGATVHESTTTVIR